MKINSPGFLKINYFQLINTLNNCNYHINKPCYKKFEIFINVIKDPNMANPKVKFGHNS